MHVLVANICRIRANSRRLSCLHNVGIRHASGGGGTSSASNVKPINKLLIANRGEIACRIMRTARRLGIRTVAVYSDVDKDSLHVSMADEAYRLGQAASADTYLRQDKIMSIAQRTESSAIHPGYGFLSENADFADNCERNNILFVGPPSQAIRDMGIKNRAKQIMSDAGVPVVHGYHGDEQSDDKIVEECERIGYPVMLKAVYGGGGKGMRIAFSREEVHAQLASARRESLKAFGNDEMLVEKYVQRPRHVEVQVFGDKLGNYVYLYERDCSVQRRHQKIVEEAPAPGISAETRKYLGEAAVKAARAVDYVGAGTVEFIMDPNQDIYFMEMNTRLQVEHPVSEMITNTDLVEWQLLAAQGHALPITDQSKVPLLGHSFECRLYAEDTRNGFMPAAGHLKHLRFPTASEHVRVETGVVQGDHVSVHYDPMIAKLVVWAEDRSLALRRMDQALSQTSIVGLETNVGFLRAILGNTDFQQALVYTDFIPDRQEQLFAATFSAVECDLHVLGQAAAAVLLRNRHELTLAPNYNRNDPFSAAGFFRLNLDHEQVMRFHSEIVDPKQPDSSKTVKYEVKLKQVGEEEYLVKDSRHADEELTFTLAALHAAGANELSFEIRSELTGKQKVLAVWNDWNLTLFTDNARHDLIVPCADWLSKVGGVSDSAAGGAVAPMPGVIEQVLVSEGQTLAAGEPMVVMVAMKMEYVIRAPYDGVVAKLQCATGDNVAKGKQLVVIEAQQSHTDQ